MADHREVVLQPKYSAVPGGWGVKAVRDAIGDQLDGSPLLRKLRTWCQGFELAQHPEPQFRADDGPVLCGGSLWASSDPRPDGTAITISLPDRGHGPYPDPYLSMTTKCQGCMM